MLQRFKPWDGVDHGIRSESPLYSAVRTPYGPPERTPAGYVKINIYN